MNGNKIGELIDTIPEGYYEFNIPPEFLNYGSEGTANNVIELRTLHMNGGHYVVTSHMSVGIQLDDLTVHVCAHNQSEADELVETLAEEGNLTFLSFSGNDSICNPTADGIIDPDCVETYKKNIGEHIILEDIKNISSEEIPKADVIVGGFPCQGFSQANLRRSKDDERNKLYIHFLRILAEKKPLYFLAENVRGILNIDKGEAVKKIVEDLMTPFLGGKLNFVEIA